MAVVFSNNATTVLSSNITNSATSIAVQDGSVFPTLSGTDYFYATLQDPGNTKREIVKVTARSGNTLTVTRAVDGSSASAFSANDAFELRLNAAALNDAVNSGTADLELNSFTGDGSEVDFTLSMEALEANTLVYIDGVYQNKTAYSISGYVLTFSAAPDNGAAIEVTTATVAPIQESTDFLLNQFTGDGSDTTFTLSSSPEENQTTVFISGVYQSKSNYSISGTTLTFSTAPPASSSIEVMVARTVVYGIGTPSNDTVSTAKIVDGAVTPAKLSLTYATETYVGTAVSNLVDSSPAALDTLNELAAALGDDPNFATTVTNSIALKAPLASPSFTGTATMDGLVTQATANSYPAGAAQIKSLAGDISYITNVGGNFLISNSPTTDQFTLSPSGSVGIGTSSAFGKLRIEDTGWSSGSPYGTVAYILGGDVNDANWGHLLVSQSGTTTGSGGKISFGSNGDNPIAGIKAYYAGATYGHLDFYTRPSGGTSTQRMRIDSSGDLIKVGGVIKGERGTAAAPPYTFSDDTDTGMFNISNADLGFSVGGTERMRIDSSGNVGIGVIPETWQSTIDVLQVGLGASFAGNTANPSRVYLSANYYINSSNQESYIATDEASQYFQNAGTHIFKVAPSGTADSAISWTTAMTVDNSGNVGIGNLSPVELLTIGSTSDTNVRAQFLSSTSGANTIQFGDGTGAAAYAGYINYTHSDNALAFATGSTERMRIDSSGRVGIGDTPISSPAGFSKTVLSLAGTAAPSVVLKQSTGNHMEWGLSANGGWFGTSNGYSLRFITNNDERMRIDSSGSVGIGISNPSDYYANFNDLVLGNTSTHSGMTIASGTIHDGTIAFADGTSGTAEYKGYIQYNHQVNTLTFGTDHTPRMTMDSAGRLLVGKTDPDDGVVGLKVSSLGVITSSIASPSTNTYLMYQAGYKFYVTSNGGISNVSANNVNLSDEREKKNIELLESQWDSLKQWSLKKFHYNADADSDNKKLGVIAQEVETHNPEVIDEFNVDDETTRMAVKEQQMMWMAIKTLQEAQTRIETLEARVTELENN